MWSSNNLCSDWSAVRFSAWCTNLLIYLKFWKRKSWLAESHIRSGVCRAELSAELFPSQVIPECFTEAASWECNGVRSPLLRTHWYIRLGMCVWGERLREREKSFVYSLRASFKFSYHVTLVKKVHPCFCFMHA